MSKPSQKQNQVQNTSQNQASTSNLNQNTVGTSALTGQNRAYAPDWISNAVQGITGNIAGLGSAPPTSYVAGSNPLLGRAEDSANALSGSPWNFDAAADLTRGVANGATPDIASMIPQFMNPYLDKVVNATYADLDHSDNIARQQSDLSNPAAFGGSGIALTKSAMEDALSRARATSLGGLRAAGYGQALGGATSQAGLEDAAANRRLQSAQQLASLSSEFDANNRANIGAQLGAGGVERGVTQDQLSAPLNLAQWQSQTLPSLLQSFFGNNTSGTTDSTQNTTGTTTGTSTGTSTGVGSGTGTSNPGTLSSLGDIAMIASLFL